MSMLARNRFISPRRRPRSRGSVLIIVIVLLLLLAILGTAYISTTRSDRVSSAQNTLNAQIDAQAEGIASAVSGIIRDNLNDDWGNLRGNVANTTPQQTYTYRYRGAYDATATYAVGDVVSYTPTVGTAPPAKYYVAVLTPTVGSPPDPTMVTTFGPTVIAPWQATTHVPVTSSVSQPWLADRHPELDATAFPSWNNISQAATPFAPALTTAPPVSPVWGLPFEDPRGSIAFPMPLIGPNLTISDLEPTFVPNGTTFLPALKIINPVAPTFAVLAGDADGDGIADSLLFRLPGVNIDGLTWYGAIRIVDNNAAVNVNTAWSRDNEYPFTAATLDPSSAAPIINYYSLFQSSVGLAEMLVGGEKLDKLSWYRLGLNFTGAASNGQKTFTQSPNDDAPIGSAAPTTAVNRTDVNFLTGTDALYAQLIRRLDNPGFNTAALRYQALPLSDEAALAYRFCLVNPKTVSSGAPSSLIENFLPISLDSYSAGNYYRQTPYTGDPSPANIGTPLTDVTNWFNDNFNYDVAPSYSTTVGAQPIRSLLVSRNAVSNYITPLYDQADANHAAAVIGEPIQVIPPTATANFPQLMLPYGNGTFVDPSTQAQSARNHFQGRWSATATYKFNDIVVGSDGLTYICVSLTPGNSATAPSLAGLPYGLYTVWQYQPWTQSPVKANVNTATFRELYRAYWSAMAGNPANATPFGPKTTVDPTYDPYWPDPHLGGGLTPNPQHEFRSPLRDPTYTYNTPTNGPTTPVQALDPTNTMLLRAALAAVNTLGLRDASQNVISRTVFLNEDLVTTPAATRPPNIVQTAVAAHVYSNAPQPFISEVYIDTGPGVGPSGYVGIELYNPYSVPLILKDWQVAYVNRDPNTTISGYPNLKFQTVTRSSSIVSAMGPMLSINVANSIVPTPASGSGNGYLPTPPASLPAATNTILIPAHGYALLENYNPNTALGTYTALPGDATARPAIAFPTVASQTGLWFGPTTLYPTQDIGNTTDVYVRNLQLLIQGATNSPSLGDTTTPPSPNPGGEFVLLRPRRADGTYTSCTDPLNYFSEGTYAAPNLYDLVPVDSFDCTGITLAAGQAYSYLRQKPDTSDPLVPASAVSFKQVFPGRYDATLTGGVRQRGTIAVASGTANTTPNIPAFGTKAAASFTSIFPAIQIYSLGYTSLGSNSHFPKPASYPVSTIPVTTPPAGVQPFLTEPASTTQPYVAEAEATPAVVHPFGTFARNGDILDVPYVGAYRINLIGDEVVDRAPNVAAEFIELNSLPMDCSFADATYADIGIPAENIGRFCPITSARTPVPPGGSDYYSWTAGVFSYLTAQSSSDSHFPNFDAGINDFTLDTGTLKYTNPDENYGIYSYYKYPFASLTTPPPGPQGTPPFTSASASPPSVNLTADGTSLDQTIQDNVGVEGLINVNTASWKVLTTLPMVPQTDPSYVADNEALAKAIVAWRETNGPFSSIYDLNNVLGTGANITKGFQNAWGTFANATAAPTSAMGTISPPDPTFPSATPSSTGIPGDYQADFNTLQRISNLITTRSDTFTVYVEVQGWQNAGTATALPVTTRRYAYIVDRSAISTDPKSRFLKTLAVPTD